MRAAPVAPGPYFSAASPLAFFAPLLGGFVFVAEGLDGLDGLGPGFWHEDQRTPLVAEGARIWSRKVFLVLVGEQFVTVDEQQESRRRLPDLGRVEELQPVAAAGSPAGGARPRPARSG